MDVGDTAGTSPIDIPIAPGLAIIATADADGADDAVGAGGAGGGGTWTVPGSELEDEDGCSMLKGILDDDDTSVEDNIW